MTISFGTSWLVAALFVLALFSGVLWFADTPVAGDTAWEIISC